ncbi:hypothetical protein NIES4071_104080 (plasmid) [Calothrix sp. NIES-4071]|nr:hypothetical protein NIES4071_104080 [Calothrix sp. NIES-4071]BAZ64395.1 hypothetical protein NIES4105_101280 [Calothrix sp. NIES-4105]
MTLPKFSPDQPVHFIGGTGVIVRFKLESGVWTYTVVMEMQIEEPPFGRIGAETMLLLHESELKKVMI